ncbi:hypothetical protein Plhal710r2_c037g0132841 [Plasmopara halstedii]
MCPTTNGFFTDNQTKLKAYDYYYNVAVKSDYGKGAKLKVIIQEQALDDACSDSIANLFPQAMRKNCEYRYDQITEKLTKKAPKLNKRKHQPSIGDIYAMMRPGDAPKETKSTSSNKHKYASQQTDTNANMKCFTNLLVRRNVQ